MLNLSQDTQRLRFSWKQRSHTQENLHRHIRRMPFFIPLPFLAFLKQSFKQEAMFWAAPPPRKASFPKGWVCREGQSSWGRVSGFAHLFASDWFLDRAAERECGHRHIFPRASYTQTSRCSAQGSFLRGGSGPALRGQAASLFVGTDPRCTSKSLEMGQGCWSQRMGADRVFIWAFQDIYPQVIPLTGGTRSPFLSVLW